MAKRLARIKSLLAPNRRLFQFRLRTLFVLVTAAAVHCVWMAWTMEHKRRERAAVAEIERLGGVALHYGEYVGTKEPPVAHWIRKVLGVDIPAEAVVVSMIGLPVGDTDLAPLKELTGLRDLYLADTAVTDAGLAHLNGLTKLEVLQLERTQITDAGLAALEGLPRLRVLHLRDTEVTDEGLALIKSTKGLQSLTLDRTRVTDGGLTHLSGLLALTRLDLIDTTVTDAGVAKLQKALPNCDIFR